LGLPFNIYTMAEARDFKFGTQLGFAKATIKPHPVALCYRSSSKFGVPFNSCATAEASNLKFGMQLGLAKAHHENHVQRKSGRRLGLGKLPYVWGFPLIFLQQPHCPLSVSGASC